jgi:DNA-binding transcriptional regulator YiaG
MYHCTGCGLRNVWLLNGYQVCKTPYGKAVSIDDLEGLHRAIALHLIEAKPQLSGAEFRFLRKEPDVSQARLAEIIGNTAQSVALSEKSGRVPKWADRLVRALYREHVSGNANLTALVERLNSLDRAKE